MTRKLRVIVNAIPAANPVTGIGRYVLELYGAMEALAGGDLEAWYFDGGRIGRHPPHGPASLKRFSRLGNLYWKLPLALALPIRLAVHARREALFRRLSAGMDVYHEAAFFPFRAAGGVGIVQTIQDLSLQLHPEWHPRERVAYARRYFEPRLGWAQRILCISEFTRGEVVRHVPALADRVSVTLLAVGPRFHPATPEEVQAVRRRYALPETYLLFVGSGDPRKNSGMLAELATSGRLPATLVSAGWGGWLEEGAPANALALGYVPDADLPALYSGAAAFVFPSLYEGFGLPVLEAMACGCPVVVPRAHSMPELVGEAGVYYGEPRDRDGLERALRDLVADPARRAALGSRGRERAALFDWRRTAELTLAALEDAVRQQGARRGGGGGPS